MIKIIDRPEDAGTSPDQKNKTNDAIIIPARTVLSYGNIKDIDVHLRLYIEGGAQKSTQELLSPEEAFQKIKHIEYLLIELLCDD